jgi:uncharacterized protein (DUF1501 family)
LPTLRRLSLTLAAAALPARMLFGATPHVAGLSPDSGPASGGAAITTAPAPLKRQIFYCETGGFDTHTDQITDQADLLGELSAALKAFSDATVELGVDSQVTTFTLSDFGRTLQPSGDGGSVGTDHGWGNHQLVMGGAVAGGDFYGVPRSTDSVFPTLTLGGPDDTDDRGRWIPTCAVEQYAATLASWFGVGAADIPTIFPLIGRFTTPNLGFLP